MEKPKFFDRNLIPPIYEFPTIPSSGNSDGLLKSGLFVYPDYIADDQPRVVQEPTAYMIGVGDNIENIRDNRPENKINLWGGDSDFDSPNILKIVGDMDDHTKFSSSEVLSNNTSDKQIGTASIQVDAGDFTNYVVGNAGTGISAWDMTYQPVVYIWIKCVDEVFRTDSGKFFGIAIGSGADTLQVELTADVNGIAPMLGVWQLYKADFRNPDYATTSTFDFTNVSAISFAWDINSPTKTFLLDGLRFAPVEYIFEYDFGRGFTLNDPTYTQSDVVKSINFFEIITTSGKVDVYVWNGSAYVHDHGQDGITGGYYLKYQSAPTPTRKLKIYVNGVNQNDTTRVGIDITTLLALEQLYTWDTDFEAFPLTNTISKTTENYLGAQKIDKQGKYFSCQLKTKGIVSQVDLDFLTALDKRKTAVWFWLNGNRPNTDFKILSEAFDEKNIFFVINNAKKFNLNQAEGIGDTGNIIAGSTIELIESAYFKIDNVIPSTPDFPE